MTTSIGIERIGLPMVSPELIMCIIGPITAHITSPARRSILIPDPDFAGFLPKRTRTKERREEIRIARTTASPAVMRDDWASCGTRNTDRKTRKKT